MDRIINLTQHQATPEQVAQGVNDLEPALAEQVRQLLTFSDIPTKAEMETRAYQLCIIAHEVNATSVMIGGAPYFMSALEEALKECNITPLYAFSKRESRDEGHADGSCRKVAVFRHIGFVEA